MAAAGSSRHHQLPIRAQADPWPRGGTANASTKAYGRHSKHREARAGRLKVVPVRRVGRRTGHVSLGVRILSLHPRADGMGQDMTTSRAWAGTVGGVRSTESTLES